MALLTVVAGAQFGSEGKGAVAAKLASNLQRNDPAIIVRVGGHNAGHTAIFDRQPRSFRTLPIAALFAPKFSIAYVGPQSVVDPLVLRDEIKQLYAVRPDVSVYVHPQATIIEQTDYDNEQETVRRIGSTGKGVGSARSRRIWRIANTVGGYPLDTVVEPYEPRVQEIFLDGDIPVLLEGNQGYGLGLHAGWYPYCTSTDCDPMSLMAQAGIMPWRFDRIDVWLVARTFPIRVAGNSGPLFMETSWEDLANEYGEHIQPEKTTVTQKVRRVGMWDPGLVKKALRAAGPVTKVALTMLDYVSRHDADVADWMDISKYGKDKIIEYETSINHGISMVGTGPAAQIYW